MSEDVDYFGKNPPFTKNLQLLEDSFIMKDPFTAPPSRHGKRSFTEYFIVIGSHCAMCKSVVCRDCSLFYKSTFCYACAQSQIHQFPLEIQSKIRKEILEIKNRWGRKLLESFFIFLNQLIYTNGKNWIRPLDQPIVRIFSTFLYDGWKMMKDGNSIPSPEIRHNGIIFILCCRMLVWKIATALVSLKVMASWCPFQANCWAIPPTSELPIDILLRSATGRACWGITWFRFSLNRSSSAKPSE